MFEFIRNHKKWMQILLALLIIPSFVVVGVSSYGNGGAGGAEVAVVGGKKITQTEWDEAQRQQIERYRGVMGEQFDQKLFETAEAKQGVLDNLIAERALDAEIARSHMTVSDTQLQRAIMDIPQFKRPDGTFDLDQYKAILNAQGLTPAGFDARMRRDLALSQLNSAIQATAITPRTVASRLSEFGEQEREVQELVFPVADYAAQVKVSDDMVKAYYDKNATLFQIPEQGKIEYVVFDQSVVESQVSVSDAEVAAFYEANKKRFTSEEERKASHILFLVKKDGSAAEKAAVKAKADSVLAELRKAPDSFADVAKTQSQDTVSNETGGDLGTITRDTVAAPAIYDAALKLKEGEISNLVETDFGFHIVRLTKLAPASTKPLDAVKGDIAAELKKQKMGKKYSELVEQFSNTVYEQAESLKPVADKLQLKIQTAENVTRTPNPLLAQAPYNNPKFLKNLFSDETIKNKRNTEPVEIAPSTLIAGRLVEYKPAAKRPLAEVDAAIRARVTAEEAGKLAKKAGEVKLAAAKAAGDAAGFGEAKLVSRGKEPTINPAAALAVFKADVAKLPAYIGVDLPGVGYGVYRIGKIVQPPQPDTARRESEREQISNVVAQQEMYNYLEALKQKAKTKVLVKPEVAAADAAK